MKGSAERARAMESHSERNLGDRCAGVCQQGLGALNPPPRPVAIRRLPEGLLEGSQKMIWAQPNEIGEHIERNVLGKVLLDEIHDALLLPRGKPSTWRRVFKAAPSPNAARLFQSFLLSIEAQQSLVDASGMCSFHRLVKEKAGRRPLSAIKLIKSDPEAMEAQREDIKVRYRSIFGA